METDFHRVYPRFHDSLRASGSPEGTGLGGESIWEKHLSRGSTIFYHIRGAHIHGEEDKGTYRLEFQVFLICAKPTR